MQTRDATCILLKVLLRETTANSSQTETWRILVEPLERTLHSIQASVVNQESRVNIAHDLLEDIDWYVSELTNDSSLFPMKR